MTLGDRLWTGESGRVELLIHGGNVARLAARTDLQAPNLADEVTQLPLALGTATFSVRTVVRTIESAPVLRGPVPVVPTRASLRTTTREAAAPRPPSAASRTVVSRLAPPPAPPRFEAKAPVIREKNGAPVSPSDAARLGSAETSGSSPRARSGSAGGSPALAPRDVRPQPTAPSSDPRPVATSGGPSARQPYARPTASPSSPPARPTAASGNVERRIQAPVVHESSQPAERVAPDTSRQKESRRPTPLPTKRPKKDGKKDEKKSSG